MSTGFSGANIYSANGRTSKRGPGCREQALYALKLGVGPPILQLLDDGYVMQTLDNTVVSWAHPVPLIDRARGILHDRVWTASEPPKAWKPAFEEWAARQPLALMDMMLALYPTDKLMHTRIHGDPTLANLLFDKENNAYIGDPIEPVGKIPGFISVDVGKLMQSVAGWEHVTFGAPLCSKSDIHYFCSTFTDPALKGGIFWLMIHALRILPYSSDHAKVAVWASDVAAIIHADIKERIHPCSTLTTLMEHSRTHAQQF